MDDIGYWCSVASDLLAIDRQVMLYLRACHMIHDPYAVCLECGKTYHVCEGHNCEYGTYIPAASYVRVRVEDSEGGEVEVKVENG